MSRNATGKVLLRAFVVALGICALMYALATVIVHLPIHERLREEIASIVLAPVIAIARLLTYVVDALGSAGTQEPASHYLPQWAQRSIGMLAVVLFVGVVFGVVVGVMSWRGKARRDST